MSHTFWNNQITFGRPEVPYHTLHALVVGCHLALSPHTVEWLESDNTRCAWADTKEPVSAGLCRAHAFNPWPWLTDTKTSVKWTKMYFRQSDWQMDRLTDSLIQCGLGNQNKATHSSVPMRLCFATHTRDRLFVSPERSHNFTRKWEQDHTLTLCTHLS